MNIRSSSDILAEINARFGFVPSFFTPAAEDAPILENLWQQTLFAYLENPLPALFKEKLNAYLSRYCNVPYCMICHSCALRPMGISGVKVLRLLNTPAPTAVDLDQLIDVLGAGTNTTTDFPAPDSAEEQALLACLVAIFLDYAPVEVCRSALMAFLGPTYFGYLTTYLAYIKTCHLWIEMHPELSHDDDLRVRMHLMPMLEEEPELVTFFRDYQVRADQERENHAVEAIARIERQRAQAEIDRVNQQNSDILNSITDAFFALDRDWRFTYLNAHAEMLFQQPREELLGKVLWDEVPTAVGSVFEISYRRALAEQVTVEFTEYSPRMKMYLDVRAYPRPDGLSIYFRNIDERRRLEEALALSEERQRFALESAEIGIWRLDILSGDIFWSDRCRAILGFLPDERVGYDDFLALIYPSDRDATDRAVMSSIAGERDYEVEFRVVWPDGSVHWVFAKGRCYEDTSGKPQRFEGIVADINDRKRELIETMARADREKNIARQLEDALKPSPTGKIPGLDISTAYTPALDEAGVGGDFYDVYPIEKGCTVLVVADLSGKGLAAAVQVATVRNMLRASLYMSKTAAVAITHLNSLLAEYDLLTGFATLFVGIFDHGARTLTYVNCGQEPGLIRDASTGAVTLLEPTGPVLGGFAGASFGERVVPVKAGDIIALFTDGLTEAGPSHESQLEIGGVADLLRSAPGESGGDALTAGEVVAHLIAGVDSFAQGGARDDVCLLVGVVG